MKHLIFWIIIIILSVVTYKNSDKYIEKQFVVVEKNKDDLQLVYLENNIHKTYTVTESEYINSDIGAIFKVEKYKTIFYLLFIITICLLIIYIAIIGGDNFDIIVLLNVIF